MYKIKVVFNQRGTMGLVGKQISVQQDQLTFSLAGDRNCNFTTGEGRIQNAFVFRLYFFRLVIVVKIKRSKINSQ